MQEEEDKYYQDAIKMFTACTAIKPNEIEAYEALRKIYFQLDDLGKSSEMKKKIAEIKAAQ
jgi:tetratricopeptide (TPR) repeat protein